MCVWADTTTTWNLEEVCDSWNFMKIETMRAPLKTRCDALTENTKRIDLNSSSSIFIFTVHPQQHIASWLFLHERSVESSTLRHRALQNHRHILWCMLNLGFWTVVVFLFILFQLISVDLFVFNIFKNDGNTKI